MKTTYDYFAELVEVRLEFASGHVFLQVAHEQSAGRLRVVFVELGLQRSEVVVLGVDALVSRHLDLTAKE